MNDQFADRVTGVLGMLLAGAYVSYARGIEDSLLADSVGASGVPTSVGVILFVASLTLFLKSWRKSQTTAGANEGKDAESQASNPHLMAAGLLLILAIYVALLPLLGYMVAIGLLVGSAAWFGGARRLRPLLLSMALAGPLLWLMFDWSLEIHMPVSSLLQALTK